MKASHFVPGYVNQAVKVESKFTDYELAVMEGGLSLEQTQRRSALREAVNVVEAFDKPYEILRWEKGDFGDVDAIARLDDNTFLSIMFNKGVSKDSKEEAWSVEFYRNNSQEVTGEGDSQRVFATVLSAMQMFIKKYKPNRITFTASKEVEQGQNTESRARLYDSLVQRYARSWGFRAFRADTGNKVIYELSRIKPVAEGAQNDLSTIIQSFVASPLGQKYKQYDCKTVTRAFVQWAEQNKIPTQVVSLAPPSADFIAKNPRYKGKSGQGDGHIMPIVNGNAIDFTVRQFGINRPFNNPLVTPTSSLPAIYGKFGYFTDKPEWFLGGKSHWIGPLNSIPSEIFNQNFGDELLEHTIAENLTQGRNLSPITKKYVQDHNWKLTTVNPMTLDINGFDDPFNRVIDIDTDHPVNFKDTIIVHANGTTIIDGFHRVYQAQRQGLEQIPAYVPVEQGVTEDAKTTEHYNGIEISMEKEDDEIMVRAMMAGGRELGHVLFVIDGEYLAPQDLEVDERYQGQGIAATMYDYVKSKGYKIRRSGQQTDAGAGFWDKHKPGKNVWEQSVTEGKDFDRCFDQACKLYDRAVSKNLEPKLVQVADFQGDGNGADPRWMKLPQHVWQHYVVIVGDQVLDPTAKQFGDSMPTQYQVSNLDRLWGQQYQIRPRQGVAENFADGRVKGKSRPGRVKRSGASCDGSVTELRSKAKNASSERAKMYHWCANMKSGRAKTESEILEDLNVIWKDVLEAGVYKGYPCTKDCSGHAAGDRWADARDITDPNQCPYSNNSFWEGCLAHTDEQE